jgi:hypothetical protein
MSYPRQAIDEAFKLLPPDLDVPPRRVCVAAAGYQETSYLTRFQYGKGPARSYWQFENGRLAAINGVLNHKATKAMALAVCKARGVEPERVAVWKAMETDDVLGAAFAALLIYTDPFPIPTTKQAAWEMYADRLWRPGKPHPEKWTESWAFALENA